MKSKWTTEIGSEYGSFVVLSIAGNRSFCRCKCGREKWIFTKNLMGRKNPKCRECFAKMSFCPRRVYSVAKNAINRCTKPSYKRYADYGGRGIKVHPEWVESVEAFCRYLITLPGWDDESLVIDRIQNDGNYEPGNLRWANRSQSQRNQRKRAERSEGHRLSLSKAKRGVPWTEQRRQAYERSHYRAK